MYIRNRLLTNLPVFNVDEPLKKVVQFFKGHAYSHVAVVEGSRFLGLLGENDAEIFETDKNIDSVRFELETFFVRNDTIWLDVLETFARNDANLMPVLGNAEEVLGYYDLTEIMGIFIETPFFNEPGAILVIEKGIKDYSFSEISQIVESNNTRFIGGLITALQNDMVQITIKVGTNNLNEIMQTFRRYNYNILFGNNDDQFLEDLKQRSDYLDKYLSV